MSSHSDAATLDPEGPPREIGISDAMQLAMQLVARIGCWKPTAVRGILVLDPDYPDA